MTERALTLREILEHESVAKSQSQSKSQSESEILMGDIEARLRDRDVRHKDLVLVHALVGLGAWFAMAFFMAFFGLAGLFHDEGMTVGIGLILMAVGILMSRSALLGVFAAQMALAASLTGDGLILVGVAELVGEHEIASLAITQLLICIVLYPLSRSYVFRLIVPVSVPAFLWVWLLDMEIFQLFHALVALEMLLFAGLWLGRVRSRALQPLAYAAAFMLPATLILMELAQVDTFGFNMKEPLWPSSLLLALGLIGAWYRLAGTREALRSPEFLLVGTGVLLLGAVAAPGVLVAIGLLLVGRILGDRYLLGLGYLFLPAFLFTYYYSLDVDLGTKSWVLAASGLVLILIRQILLWLSREEEGA